MPPPKALPPRDATRDSLAFIDTETTGLSTGAGTYVFAFGVGRFEGDAFTVRQLFLEDFPGEPEFLEEALRLMGGSPIAVSYNGKSFDFPLLRNRCVMNRMDWPSITHVDLLHTARRLWGRACGGSALKDMEDRVLERPRVGDVPGAEAPERYFRYLATGDAGAILPVLEHHAKDIAILPLLMAEAIKAFTSPDSRAASAAMSPDPVNLGMILYACGMDGWEEVLGRAAGEERSAIALASIYKREGRWSEAMGVLSDLTGNYRAQIELAKIAEHRLRDFRRAMEACDAAARIDVEGLDGRELSRRRARLRRRMDNR